MKIDKKIIPGFVLVFSILLVLSTVAFAAPFTDSFRGGLIQINSFFTGQQYKTYAQTIDFVFFAILFIAIYMMGARYAFKEVKRPEQVIVILLGLMTAFLLVLGGYSPTLLLPFLNWLLYLLLFIFYWWLLKGVASKFWRFLLALLLTLLTIALLQGLFGSLTAPDSQGFLPSFGKSFGPISIPGISWPSGFSTNFGDLFGSLPSVTTPTDTGTLTPTTTPSGTTPDQTKTGGGTPNAPSKGWPWWVWFLIAFLLLGGGFLGRNQLKSLWNRTRTRREGQQPAAPPGTTPQTTADPTIAEFLRQIDEYIEKKAKALRNIYRIYRLKREADQDFVDRYHKTIYFLYNEDPAYLLDPQKGFPQQISEEQRDVKELLKYQVELCQLLREILAIEYQLGGIKYAAFFDSFDYKSWFDELKMGRPLPSEADNIDKWVKLLEEMRKGGDITKWVGVIKKKYIYPPQASQMKTAKEFMASKTVLYQNGVKTLFNYITQVGLITDEARVAIANYFSITKDHIKSESDLRYLLDPAKLEEWVKKSQMDKWKNLIDMKTRESGDFSKLMPYMTGDSKKVNGEPYFLKTVLFPAINKERKYLRYIKLWIQFLESNTQIKVVIQDLRVEPIEANSSPGVNHATPIRIYTKIAQGIAPFRGYCFVFRYDKDNYVNAQGTRIKGDTLTLVYPDLSGFAKATADPKGQNENWEAYLNRVWNMYMQNFEAYKQYLLPFSKPYANILDTVEFTSENFGNLDKGKYRVIFYVTGSSEIKRLNWDQKSADIYIKEGEQDLIYNYDEPVYPDVNEERTRLESLWRQVQNLRIRQVSKDRIKREIDEDIHELKKTKEISQSKDRDKIVVEAEKEGRSSKFRRIWQSLANEIRNTANIIDPISNFTNNILGAITQRRRKIEFFLRRKIGTVKTIAPISARSSGSDDISRLLGIDERDLTSEGRIRFRGR